MPFTNKSHLAEDIITCHEDTQIKKCHCRSKELQINKLKKIRDKKAKKIRELQHSHAKNQKRIKRLQNLLLSVKKKKWNSVSLATEQSKGLVLIEGSESSKGGPYSEELKAFTKTLYNISPKAYNYVRDIFHDAMPNSRTIGRWQNSIDLMKNIDIAVPAQLMDDG